MLDLSSHILDIAENSVRAGATKVEIIIREDSGNNLLTIEVNDNGKGMTKEETQKAHDPFYTTKTVRRVGLGIPLLAEATQRANGFIKLSSKQGRGTKLKAVFQLDHLDRQPLGNITSTIINLIAGNSSVDFIYKHRHNDRRFSMDTRNIRKEIGDLPINHSEILRYIRNVIIQGLGAIQPKA
jgi:signal transduction histidine kinase